MKVGHRSDVIEAGVYWCAIVRKKAPSAQTNRRRETECGLSAADRWSSVGKVDFEIMASGLGMG